MSAEDDDKATVLFSDDVEKIKTFLMEYPSALDGFIEYTPLMHAANCKRSDIVDFLIEFTNSDSKFVNIRTAAGKTALHYGCLNINEYIIRKLIQTGASGIFQDLQGNTPLHFAAKYANNPNIIYILYPGSNPSIFNTLNQTPLMTACAYNNNREVILALVNISNNINQQNSNGETCLHVACSYNNTNIIETLLSHGADLTITSGSDLTPYDMSDNDVDEIIYKYLQDKHHQTPEDEKIMNELNLKTNIFD